ncbi:hypothetical protein RhiirA5_411253 [Rhizophagus irregularis]|uniref:Uncharacterized protein n=1 Tax=Rhizophagus irregularis TaxID=588596 RepID=A0A2I1FS14_9GLOM|nr:hypothetical protein RhiirA5_411253 [Rhizophagus irregularis]PKY37154.1 hypothetical protein RhiirB3_461625 [Rhizophagus irregularis]
MKCIMKCNKKENWNHLFECQAYEVAWEKILKITTKESIIICLKQKQIKVSTAGIGSESQNFFNNKITKRI